MKKIFTIIVSAAALLITTGCNDFLDRQPITNITPEKYFKTADELEQIENELLIALEP